MTKQKQVMKLCCFIWFSSVFSLIFNILYLLIRKVKRKRLVYIFHHVSLGKKTTFLFYIVFGLSKKSPLYLSRVHTEELRQMRAGTPRECDSLRGRYVISAKLKSTVLSVTLRGYERYWLVVEVMRLIVWNVFSFIIFKVTDGAKMFSSGLQND